MHRSEFVAYEISDKKDVYSIVVRLAVQSREELENLLQKKYPLMKITTIFFDSVSRSNYRR